MAVQFDATTLRTIVGEEMYDKASDLLDSVIGLEETDGGVAATVTEGSQVYDAWAGIVEEVFTGECSGPCPEDAACHHVAAVALAGVVAGSRWYASARTSHRSGGNDRSPLRPETERAKDETPLGLHAAASALSHAELLDLVVAWAETDPELADALRARAER